MNFFDKYSWQFQLTVACIVALLGLTACISEKDSNSTEQENRELGVHRRFEFRYQVLMPTMPENATTYRVWIPLPAETEEQQVHNLKIVSPVRYEQRTESTYGNHYAYIDLTPGSYPWPLSVTLGFEVTRKENYVALEDRPYSAKTDQNLGEDMKKFLQPNHLVPIDGLIGKLSQTQTAGAENTLDKARLIYDYVVSTMSYDKSGEGWGRGDAIFACTDKRGNCTDFHALLIGMMRAAGIPAKFEIGFPLPSKERRGNIGGYHCWAQFYLQGLGWIPIDASEAWKDPSRKNYFFGAHDEHRVHFTTGRDLILDEDQKTKPLNYFIYPLLEIDGKSVELLEKRFWFRDLTDN
ncbi:MAG: transglutaminase [Solibacterales bacterium]|nr:transglutaminase [Bryobacterales bacterium]|tara:strand:- start:3872 stop:4924 length:1053 start_codon:yes stop_codon:yes gene_type:complete